MGNSCGNSLAVAVISVAMLLARPAYSQGFSQIGTGQGQGNSWLTVEFPKDSPVLIVSSGLGSTTAHIQGASIALEIRTSLLLRNTGKKAIHGLTLRVDAGNFHPAAQGSVTMPSLDAQPGDTFPVRIDMELVRPFNVQRSEAPLVQVSLDCALFDDLTAYGPDKLGSKRALMVYELESRRDRHYLANLLNTGRVGELRRELDFGLGGSNLPQLAMELLRAPDRSNEAGHQHPMAVDVVAFSDSPIEAKGGTARVVGNDLEAPMVRVTNRSQRPVRSIEMGWIVRDENGRDFMAGSLPKKIVLNPVESAQMTEAGDVRFLRPGGRPLDIENLLAFVNSVEYGDGSLWIPSRADIDQATGDPVLRHALAASPEQQRLENLYRRHGMNALRIDLERTK